MTSKDRARKGKATSSRSAVSRRRLLGDAARAAALLATGVGVGKHAPAGPRRVLSWPRRTTGGAGGDTAGRPARHRVGAI